MRWWWMDSILHDYCHEFACHNSQVFIVDNTSQQIGELIWYYWHRGTWLWMPRLLLVPWISSLLVFYFWRAASCNPPVGRKLRELSVYTWCHWCSWKISIDDIGVVRNSVQIQFVSKHRQLQRYWLITSNDRKLCCPIIYTHICSECYLVQRNIQQC